MRTSTSDKENSRLHSKHPGSKTSVLKTAPGFVSQTQTTKKRTTRQATIRRTKQKPPNDNNNNNISKNKIMLKQENKSNRMNRDMHAVSGLSHTTTEFHPLEPVIIVSEQKITPGLTVNGAVEVEQVGSKESSVLLSQSGKKDLPQPIVIDAQPIRQSQFNSSLLSFQLRHVQNDQRRLLRQPSQKLSIDRSANPMRFEFKNQVKHGKLYQKPKPSKRQMKTSNKNQVVASKTFRDSCSRNEQRQVEKNNSKKEEEEEEEEEKEEDEDHGNILERHCSHSSLETKTVVEKSKEAVEGKKEFGRVIPESHLSLKSTKNRNKALRVKNKSGLDDSDVPSLTCSSSRDRSSKEETAQRRQPNQSQNKKMEKKKRKHNVNLKESNPKNNNNGENAEQPVGDNSGLFTRMKQALGSAVTSLSQGFETIKNCWQLHQVSWEQAEQMTPSSSPMASSSSLIGPRPLYMSSSSSFVTPSLNQSINYFPTSVAYSTNPFALSGLGWNQSASAHANYLNDEAEYQAFVQRSLNAQSPPFHDQYVTVSPDSLQARRLILLEQEQKLQACRERLDSQRQLQQAVSQNDAANSQSLSQSKVTTTGANYAKSHQVVDDGDNNKRSKKDSSLSEQDACVVCLEVKRDTTFACGHLCLCHICSQLLVEKKCPVCRYVGEPIRIYT